MDKKTLLLYVLFGLLVVGVLFKYSPACVEVPGRDSGLFLYAGDRVLNGGVPYLGFWDHKPPLIYFIDAFGLLVGGGSIWGVWLLEFVAVYSAALVGFVLMRPAFGVLPAFLATVTWVLSISLVLTGGNFTEEFALPLLFAALYLFWRSVEQGSCGWRGFLIGALSAVCLLLKPNMVSIPLSIVIVLLVTGVLSRRWRRTAVDLSLVLAGGAVVILVGVVYLAANNALGAFVDQVIGYNLVYPAASLRSKAESVLAGLYLLSGSGISVIAAAAWVAGIVLVWRRSRKVEGMKPLLYVALIGLPIELLLCAIPGRRFGHYYVAWLPLLALLVAFFTYGVMATWSDHRRVFEIGKVVVTRVGICLFALLIAMSMLPLLSASHQTASCIAGRGEEGELATWSQSAEYITEHTVESDYVLVWGAETVVNFLAHRQAPTRYVYQWPLYHPRYANEDITNEFLGDIMLNKPALIVDTSPTSTPVPPLDSIARQEWAYDHPYLPEMDEVFEYIASNYRFVGAVGPGQWLVYRYTGEDAADR